MYVDTYMDECFVCVGGEKGKREKGKKEKGKGKRGEKASCIYICMYLNWIYYFRYTYMINLKDISTCMYTQYILTPYGNVCIVHVHNICIYV